VTTRHAGERKEQARSCLAAGMGALGSVLSSIPFGVCIFRFPRQPQALFKITLGIF